MKDGRLPVKVAAADIGVRTPKLSNMKQECQPLKHDVQLHLTEKMMFAYLVTYLALCTTQISSPYSQKAVTGFYPEVRRCSPQPHTLFKTQFNIILTFTPRFLKWTSLFGVSSQNFVCIFTYGLFCVYLACFPSIPSACQQ